MDKKLHLGTRFYGEIDKKFEGNIRKLRRLLTGLNTAIVAQKSMRNGYKKYLQDTSSQMSEYAKRAGNATNETNKFQKALTHFGRGQSGEALKKLEADLRKVERAIIATSVKMNAMGRNGDAFYKNTNRIAMANAMWRGELKATSSGIQKVEKKLSALSGTQNKSAAATKKATAAAKSYKKSQVEIGKQISRVEGGMNRLVAAMKVVASYTVAGSIFIGLTNALRAGTDEIIQYDQALKNLRAISNATDAQLASMGSTIRDIAANTKFSTTEIAQGMVFISQAGYSAEESLSIIRNSSQLAIGTLSDMTTTTDLMTTTLRAFGMEAIESSRVADVMANAINESKLTIDKLRISFNYIGAAAKQTGLSLEETGASAMVLANNGLRASTIGTGMRQVLARLLAPSKKLQESFEKHGIALRDVNPRLQGYQEALQNLAPAIWDNAKGTVDMSKAYELFGLRGAQAVAILVKSIMGNDFSDALEKVYQVGTASEKAAIQSEGLAVKFKQLADRSKNIAIALGDQGLKGVLSGFVDAMRAAALAVEKFVRSGTGGFLVQMTLWSAATMSLIGSVKLLTKTYLVSLAAKLGVIAVEFIAVTKATKLATAAMWLFQGTVNPIVAVGLAVGALVAWLVKLNSANKKAIKVNSELAVEHKKSFRELNLYRKNLQVLHELQDKDQDAKKSYQATLERLASKYKDLGSEVELAAMKHDDLIKKMKEVSLMELQAGLNSQLDAIEAAREQYEKVVSAEFTKDKHSPRVKGQTRFMSEEDKARFEKARQELILKYNAKVIAARNKATETEKEYYDTLWNGVKAQTFTLEYAERLIKFNVREGKLSEDLAKKKIPELRKAYEALQKEKKKVAVASNQAKELEDIKGQKAHYQQLAAYERDRTVLAKLQHATRLADLKIAKADELKEIENNEKRVQEINDYYDKLFKKNDNKLSADLFAIRQDRKKKSIELARAEAEERIKLREKELGGLSGEDQKQSRHELEIDYLTAIVKLAREKHEWTVKNDNSNSDKTAVELKKAEVDLQEKQNEILKESTDRTIPDRNAKEDKHIKQLEEQRKNLEEINKLKLKTSGFKEGFQSFLRDVEKDNESVAEGVKKVWKSTFRELKSTLSDIGSDIINSAIWGDEDDDDNSSLKSLSRDASSAKHAYQELAEIAADYYANMGSLEGEALADAQETYSQMVQDRTDAYTEYVEAKAALEEEISDKEKEEKEKRLEYVKDFTKAVTKAITDFMAQQVVQGFFGAMASAFGSQEQRPTSSPYAQQQYPYGQYAVNSHTGSRVGKTGGLRRRKISPWALAMAPQLHNGLRRDEFPAILQKGETVYSKADSKRMEGGVNLQVNVQNKTGTEAKASTSEPKFDGSKWVVNVILDAVRRNKDGFRDGMKGALG